MLFPEKLENEENLEEGIIFANLRIRELERDILLLTDLLNLSLKTLFKQLNDKQKEIFLNAAKILIKNTFSLNKLSENISKKLEITFSTTKWNLTKLRDFGLFETTGERGNTKTTFTLTSLGNSLYSIYSQRDRNLLEHKEYMKQ